MKNLLRKKSEREEENFFFERCQFYRVSRFVKYLELLKRQNSKAAPFLTFKLNLLSKICISLHSQSRFCQERDPERQNRWKKPSLSKKYIFFSVFLSCSGQTFHQKCKVTPSFDSTFNINLENGISFEF